MENTICFPKINRQKDKKFEKDKHRCYVMMESRGILNSSKSTNPIWVRIKYLNQKHLSRS